MGLSTVNPLKSREVVEPVSMPKTIKVDEDCRYVLNKVNELISLVNRQQAQIAKLMMRLNDLEEAL